MTEIESTAMQLLEAYRTGPVAPVRTQFAERDLAQAYEVQNAQVLAWLNDGRRAVGRKIGLTSPAVQQQLGVSEPDFGRLFADMVFGTGEAVSMASLLQPRVEAEIALILNKDLPQHCVTHAELLSAIEWVIPALEIVDSRIASWDINIVDTVADNASAGAVVLGGPARRIDDLDLINCPMVMVKNGEQVSAGLGRDCLGGPLNAAVWLARKAVEVGSPLKAGEIILTGALGPMSSVGQGDEVKASIAGIGDVQVRFTP